MDNNDMAMAFFNGNKIISKASNRQTDLFNKAAIIGGL